MPRCRSEAPSIPRAGRNSARSEPAASRCAMGSLRIAETGPGVPISVSALQRRPGGLDDVLDREPEFLLQRLERCRRAEGVHADRRAVAANVALPPEGRGLLDRDPCRDCRSEEHTSELQSCENLVCRLLLEKKKKNNTIIILKKKTKKKKKNKKKKPK